VDFGKNSPKIVQCTHVVSAQQADQCANKAHFSLNKSLFWAEKKRIAKLVCFDAQSTRSTQICLRN
jgi:hypothetical protein